MTEYYEMLKRDLQLLERFDSAGMLRSAQQPSASGAPNAATAGPPSAQGGAAPQQVTVALELAYIETSTTADSYTTRGTIAFQALQPEAMQIPGLPGQVVGQPVAQQAVALEVTSDRWEQLA
jgi:hypothetical protein